MRRKYIISVCAGSLVMTGLLLWAIWNWRWRPLPIDLEVENISKVKIICQIDEEVKSAELESDEWRALFRKLAAIKGYESDYQENFKADEIVISIRYKNDAVATLMFGADRIPQMIINERERRIYNIRNYRCEEFNEFLN